MTHRIAFAGFRHPHIFSLWDATNARADCQIAAACETDAPTRKQLQSGGKIHLTHTDFENMLRDSGCNIVAIGDVYARRGALAIAALKAGKHVISDKPLCTNLEELEQIARLARESSLSVSCQLDLIEAGVMRRLREVIRAGTLGRICTITIGAQHPLRYGSRAAWYFESGQHGGTINDIGIHIFDLATWLTGSEWVSLISAREWNAKAAAAPHFKDCAQFHGLLQNGTSCFADVSYLAPDKLGYELPYYWRITVHGTCGLAEAGYAVPHLTVVTDNDTAVQEFPGAIGEPRGYLQDFLDEISEVPIAEGLTTQRVLHVSRWALEAQLIARQKS